MRSPVTSTAAALMRRQAIAASTDSNLIFFAQFNDLGLRLICMRIDTLQHKPITGGKGHDVTLRALSARSAAPAADGTLRPQVHKPLFLRHAPIPQSIPDNCDTQKAVPTLASHHNTMKFTAVTTQTTRRVMTGPVHVAARQASGRMRRVGSRSSALDADPLNDSVRAQCCNSQPDCALTGLNRAYADGDLACHTCLADCRGSAPFQGGRHRPWQERRG